MLKRGILVTAVTLAILMVLGCGGSSGNNGGGGDTQPIIHTVTFVDHDGTELKSEQVEHGSAAAAPSDPERDGYTFTGWSPSDFSEITADTTITAQYAINTWTVTFVDHDETELKVEQVEHGSAAAAPSDPERDGYTFTGWSPSDFSSITSDTTITAQYAINTWTVTFVDHDETELKVEQVEHGSAAVPPAEPARSGHIFVGWEPSSLSAITTNTNFIALYVLGYSVGIEPAGIAENTILRLQLNGEHDLELDSTATGNFVTFDQLLLDGDAYQVTIAAHPVNQLCQLSGHSDGTIDGQNITDITVQCTTTRLNDTGIDWWVDGSTNILEAPPTDYPGQDADYGRDAAARTGALTKVGAGAAGFDYTKMSNSGHELPADAVLGSGPDDWACTRDNVTGLIWEVKVNDSSHLRHMDHTYTWYNTDSATNGGNAGIEGGSGCNGTIAACNTQSFAQAVNAQGLCGYDEWRLPSLAELRSIIHYGRFNPAIDVEHFPNTPSNSFWSFSPSAEYADYAWYVFFGSGYVYYYGKNNDYRVRLVRAGQ